MAESDELEFDKGLSRIAEGQAVEPSPSLYAGIRLAAVERQLIGYQSAALWLKGTIGVLAVLLGVTGLLLYKARNEPNTQIATAVIPAKPDTVYVTRTEQVFTDRPVVVYVEKKSAGNQSETILPGQDLTDEPSPLISSKQNERLVNERNNNLSKIDAANNPSGKNEFNGIQRRPEENLTANEPDIPALENSKTNVQPNDNSDEGKGESLIGQKTKGEKSRAMYPTKNSGNKSGFSALENAATAGKDAPFESGKAERIAFDVSRLNASVQKSKHSFRLPKIAYQKSGQVQAATPPPKVAKIRTPLAERLSLSVYASPDWSRLDVRRDEPDAFNYGDEELQTGILAGVRVGLKLGGNWSLLAGAEFSGSSFDEGMRRQILTAENVNGQIGFPYRTALGTMVLPASLFSSPPAAGDRIGLELDDPIERYALNLPLVLRYDIWRKRFLLLNRVPLRFTAYGLLGGYAQIPLRQEGELEIYEESGREFEADITGFRNLRPAYGLSLGAGAELGVGKHLSIFAEPTYMQGLTSVVRGMPLSTTIGGFGVKVGAKWGFGKK